MCVCVLLCVSFLMEARQRMYMQPSKLALINYLKDIVLPKMMHKFSTQAHGFYSKIIKRELKVVEKLLYINTVLKLLRST